MAKAKAKTKTQEETQEPNIFILVDTSYWIFYRYYAISQWWGHSNPETPLTNPYENIEFVEKFMKTFNESLEGFKKKQKIHKKKTTIIAVRDCPRATIWRNNLYSDYKATRDKATRDKGDEFGGAPFFKHIYQDANKLLYEAGANAILQFPNLEADDVIALTKNYIRNKYVDAQIYIIANDHDYLQLLDEHTEIVNFQNKFLKEASKVFREPEKNLFYKIVLGDKSDNIMPIFKKCGPKTCEKYYENNELFLEALKKENAYEKYELNKKLVDFRELPHELVSSFTKENSELLEKL
jgi:5'-3' exonuclease